MPNCSRYFALQSTFAPLSTRNVKPFFVGRQVPNTGRSTPGRRPTMSREPVRRAPVLPAETKASASPFFTSCIPTTIEEFFFLRIAIVGTSSVLMTSSALTTSIFSFGYVYFASSRLTSSSLPTSFTSTFISLTASTAPLTVSTGAKSPPMASSATIIF